MPTRRKDRGGTYYVKRRFRGVGQIFRSLGTRNKGRATRLEDVLVSLYDQGRAELVRAFDRGHVTIEELAEYYETSRISELTARLRRADATLEDACEAALRDKSPDVTDSTLARYETGLSHLRRFAGADTIVRDVLTKHHVQAFKGFRLNEGAAHETVNNDLIALSVLASYAQDQGWIEERPKIKRFGSKVRVNYLESAQLATYMAVVRRPFRPLFQLLVGTGMRLGEGEALRVCDLRIAEDEGRALVQDAKTTSGVRAVFLPPWVAEALRQHIEEHRCSGTDPLFTIPRRTVQKEHRRSCQLSGIHGYTIHDHRHTAAVHLARAGMPLNLLQQQLGHATIAMTMRYASFHPDYSDVGKYFERVGERLGLAGAGNRSGNRTLQATNEASR